MYATSGAFMSGKGYSAGIYFPVMITDRTIADSAEVDRIKAKRLATGYASLTTAEQSAYLLGLKGEIRHGDLNRLGDALVWLDAVLNEYAYPVDLAPKQDWAVTDIPTTTLIDVLHSDIAEIKASIYATGAIPASMNILSVTDMNNIESIFNEVERRISSVIAGLFYSGEIYAGEGW